jgi:hypothetical protein
MPVIVAGYYMDFSTTRAIMAKLNIDDRGAQDDRLELSINNWLGENGKTTPLAGAIIHPSARDITNQEDGMLLMTGFVYDSFTADPIVEEGDKDRAVKAWAHRQTNWNGCHFGTTSA